LPVYRLTSISSSQQRQQHAMFEGYVALAQNIWDQLITGGVLQYATGTFYGSLSFVLFLLLVTFDFAPRLFTAMEWAFKGEGCGFTDHVGIRLAYVLIVNTIILFVDAVVTTFLPGIGLVIALIAVLYYIGLGVCQCAKQMKKGEMEYQRRGEKRRNK